MTKKILLQIKKSQASNVDSLAPSRLHYVHTNHNTVVNSNPILVPQQLIGSYPWSTSSSATCPAGSRSETQMVDHLREVAALVHHPGEEEEAPAAVLRHQA